MIALRILDHLGRFYRSGAPLTVPRPCAMTRSTPARVSKLRQWGPVFPFFMAWRRAMKLPRPSTQKSAAAILACGRPNGTRGLTPLFLQ